MEYLFYKLVHIVSVVLFLGNITLSTFWMRRAAASGDGIVIAYALRTIVALDSMITMPASVILAASGVMTAMIGGYNIMKTGWIVWPLTLFTLSAILFMALVAPLQRKMLAAAEPLDMERYRPLYRMWNLWGANAVLLPLAAIVMMVLKLPL